MSGLVSRWWHRLFGVNLPPDHRRLSRIADAGLEVLTPPLGFTPREGETVHAEVMAQCRDESRNIEHGGGVLLVTNKSVVFFTSRQKWRFPWRRIEHVGLSKVRRLV